jgi:hypothetical protein
MSVVVEHEGYGPAIFAMKELPQEVKLTSVRDRRLVTRGLFSPLNGGTPSVELKKLMVSLDLAVVFLGSANKDLDGRWLMRGQWLEAATGRSSPVLQAADLQLSVAVRTLVKELLEFLDSEGRVIAAKPSAPVVLATNDKQISQEPESTEKPFYKTWWFWTLVGAGAVGVGAGTYLLMNPSESLQVKVVQSQ